MNQYFICNSNNFPQALEWANKQAKDGNVKLVAYSEVQADRIMRNADGLHEWDVPYHFARTAASVMRLGMLMATGLEPRYYRSTFTSAQENRRAFNKPENRRAEGGSVNRRDLLAASKNETRLFFSYFDTMYADHYIMALLLGQPEGEQRRSIRRQMIVVNPGHNVIWQIVSTLYIVSNGERVLEAKPFVAVWRYDPVPGRDIVPIFPDDDYDDEKDVDNQNDAVFVDVIEGIRNMGLEKPES